MKVSLSPARPPDAAAIASLRNAVADDLTQRYGAGHWSHHATEKGALRDIETSRVLVLRTGGAIDATLRLATKKPWAIDVAYFTACKKPVYLHDMAIPPSHQRSGLGRQCIEQAIRLARDLPADAIRLDAYDAPAGAGGFYAKCGFREMGRVTYRKSPLIYYELLL